MPVVLSPFLVVSICTVAAVAETLPRLGSGAERTMRLEGFTSRWRTPAPCAAASPEATWTPISQTSSNGSPSGIRLMRRSSDSPSMNSIAMKWTPWSWPTP